MGRSKDSFITLPLEIQERILELVQDSHGSLAVWVAPMLRLRLVSRRLNSLVIKVHFKTLPQRAKLVLTAVQFLTSRSSDAIGPGSTFKNDPFFFNNVRHLVVDVAAREARDPRISGRGVCWIRDAVLKCEEISHLTIIVSSRHDIYMTDWRYHIEETVQRSVEQNRKGYTVTLDFIERGF